MKTDKAIFGLRFGANEELVPDPNELNTFLEHTKKDDGSGPQSGDLARYRELLRDFDAFEQHKPHDTAHYNFREKMFFGVLAHSFFVSKVLLSSVAQYKYHAHALRSLDFRKPTAFIRSAEEEISKLNPKKKADEVKLARLQGMVDERNKALAELQKRWAALIAELRDIALYLRDNLVRIETICEASIVILVELQVGQKKEQELIEDIKTQFKEQLRDSLHQGSITKEDLEIAKKDVATLSQEMSTLFKDDVFALTGLFEAIHDHTRKSALAITALAEKLNSKKDPSQDEYREVFTQLEQALVSLVSGFHFEMKTPRIHTETAYQSILAEKRKETLDYLFALLERERRSEKNRRSEEDRRQFHDPDYEGPERRNGKDRRTRTTRHS